MVHEQISDQKIWVSLDLETYITSMNLKTPGRGIIVLTKVHMCTFLKMRTTEGAA